MTTRTMTVKITTPDGVWLAWGTVPSNLTGPDGTYQSLRGLEVEFQAALKAGREPHFALFSRPTKAVLVK